MPVRFDERTVLEGGELVNQEAIEVESQVSTMDTIKAAFALENTVGSLLNMESGLPNQVDNPDFNPFDLMTDDEKLDSVFSSNASLADNETELEAVRRQSTNERKNRAILADAGAMGFGVTLAAAIFDPINLIPVGGTAYKSYKTGKSILAGAAATGSVAAGSAAVTEANLHATQLERTYSESAINIGGAMLLGGALGGGVTALNNKALTKIDAEITDSMNVEPKIQNGLDSVGAARVSQNVQIKGKAARVISKALAFDPLTRSLTARSQVTRDLAATLAENPYAMDGETGTAVESLVKIYDGYYVAAFDKHLKAYEGFQKELSGGTGLGRVINKKGMSRTEWNEAVTKELRNPKPDAAPQIKEAAQAWKAEFYDPIKQQAIDVGIFADDVSVTTAENYVNRMWQGQKIAAEKPKFIEAVAKWLGNQDLEQAAKGKELDAELKTLNAEIDKLRKLGNKADKKQIARINKLEELLDPVRRKEALDLDELDYRDTAEQIADRIIGSPDGVLPYDYQLGKGSASQPNFKSANSNLKGALKSRVFNIPDDLIEDFLVNDMEELGASLLRSVAPDIEITRAFGDVEMKQQIKDIQNDYSELARGATTEKQRLKLDKEKNIAIRDVTAMRDRMRNIYGKEDSNNLFPRIWRSVRDLNYMRFMGGVVASSIPDVARTFMAEGFGKTFSKGLIPLIKNVKSFKVAANEGRAYGIGVDTIVNGRSEVLADVADYASGGTAVERGLRSGARKFSNVNMMNQWTTGMKQLHAVVMMQRILPELKSGKVSKQVGEKLKRLGINADDQLLITEQLNKHGGEIDGHLLANAKQWDDQSLERVWGAALRKESDRVIVVPGQEKPLFMSSELGKTIMQFRSFMFASTQRMLIAGIQGQEASYMGGMVSMISLGAMTYAFKQWDADREVSDDPAVWISEGIDRSGALGLIGEINNTVEKISGNNFGLRPLLSISEPASRFASRSQAESMLGPTFGSFLGTTLQVSNSLSDNNEWKAADTRALRRLLPYQNLTLLRQGFDKIEESISE